MFSQRKRFDKLVVLLTCGLLSLVRRYRQMGRIIAIGDVHGCADEFDELLQLIAPNNNDRLIQLGDLINRGPDSRGVIALAREYGVESILGNHEVRILRALRERKPARLKDYDLATIQQLHGHDWDYLNQLPPHIFLKKQNTVCVHGGFLPHIPWDQQALDTITRIQVITAAGKPAKYAEAPDAPAWTESWPGKPFVVYGHSPRTRVCERPGSIGIDTACVYGGHLSAYVLGEGTLYQVPARKVYVQGKPLPNRL